MKLTGSIKITKQIKPTKAFFFSTFKVGDILHLSITLNKLGRGRSGLYALHIRVCRDGDEEETHFFTLNNLVNRLQSFEWEEV